MKKLFALLAIMVVALGTLFTPTMAAQTTDLNGLAQYFPASTPVLVSFRTSDDFIKDMDDLIAKIASQIPGMAKPPTIEEQFDMAVTGVMGSGDFNSAVRNWLGDEASIGIYSFEGMMGRGNSSGKPPHFLAAVSIKDQKAAETFWKAALGKTQGGYESTTEGDFILFTPDKNTSANGIVAIGKDVLFVASYKEDIPFDVPASPLSEDPKFTDSLKLLPESDYYVTVYANLADLFQQAMAMQSDMTGTSASQAAMMKQFEPILKNLPPEVIGYTLLDERSLVFDFAVPYGDLMKEFEAIGYSTAMPVPVDPAFAANILSGAPFVIHSTNLGATLSGVLKNFHTQAGMMSSMGVSGKDMEDGITKLTFAIQGLTGKDLEKDILPAMTGNYALYLALSPALSDISSEKDLTKQLPVDFGFLTEMSDPSVTQAIMKGAQTALTSAKEVKVTTEKIGGADAVVITSTSGGAQMFAAPIELVLTGNDKLFFFGTRRAAEAALNGTGGLDQDASFKEAAGYMVDSPSAIAYLASEGLKPLGKILGMTGSKRDQAQFETFLKLLSSASVSSTTKDNVGYARFVWTLPE